jgi:hypothetical protein
MAAESACVECQKKMKGEARRSCVTWEIQEIEGGQSLLQIPSHLTFFMTKWNFQNLIQSRVETREVE